MEIGVDIAESRTVRQCYEWESDTDSIGGISEVGVDDVIQGSVPDVPIPAQHRIFGPQHAIASLDTVNLVEMFSSRARVMQSVKWVLRGAFRTALKVAMQEILDGTEANSDLRVTRGWNLFFLLPRMILFRPHRGGNVPRKQLESQIVAFKEGRWMELLRKGAIAAETAHTHSVRRRRREDDDDEARKAARAMSLTQMGELSAARPGTMSTLRALTDPKKQPFLPRTPLSREVTDAQPSKAFPLDSIEFLTCLRKARRGAAAGPSGMTSDNLFPVLESDGDSDLLCRVASLPAVGQVPDPILRRLGRMTALSRSWPTLAKPTLANPTLANFLTDIGQSWA